MKFIIVGEKENLIFKTDFTQALSYVEDNKLILKIDNLIVLTFKFENPNTQTLFKMKMLSIILGNQLVYTPDYITEFLRIFKRPEFNNLTLIAEVEGKKIVNSQFGNQLIALSHLKGKK